MCVGAGAQRSGESQWEEPGVPYRPLVRDSYTGKLVQAWPYLDMPPPSQKKAARGACMRCLTKEASRRCNTCSLPATRQVRCRLGWCEEEEVLL